MTVEITSLDEKIIKQIEYYFGDINLCRDEFLKTSMAEDDGWVSMETMLKFNRLKTLSDNPEVIISAISKSTCDLMEISEDKTKIRRNPAIPLPESMRDAMNKYADNTVYFKGFASEDALDDLIKFLETAGPTINVHMRRMPRDKKFKGSVFAVFKNKEDAEKCLTMDETKEYKGKELIRMSQDAYFAKKKGERDAAKDERQKRVEEAAAARDSAIMAQMTLGTILVLSGLTKTETKDDDDKDHYANNKANMMEFKEALAKISEGIAEVAWLDMEPAEGKAVVRFQKENTAALVLAKINETSFKFKDCELTGIVLTGDEEKQHWKRIFDEKNKQRRGNMGGNRGGGYGRGRGRGGKRGGSHHRTRSPPSKRAKTE